MIEMMTYTADRTLMDWEDMEEAVAIMLRRTRGRTVDEYDTPRGRHVVQIMYPIEDEGYDSVFLIDYEPSGEYKVDD